MERENTICEPSETTGVRVDRLRDVVRAVENAPGGEFDMTRWACGTSACAVGWYCIANPGCGLYLDMTCETDWEVMSQTESNWDAVKVHFGLDIKQAGHLFGSYKRSVEELSRTAVLRRLRAFIADNSPPLYPRPAEDRFAVSPVDDQYMSRGFERLERALVDEDAMELVVMAK